MEPIIDLRRPALGGNGPERGLFVHAYEQLDHNEPGKPFICCQAYLLDDVSGVRRVAFGATLGEALARGEAVARAYPLDLPIPLDVQTGGRPIALTPPTSAAAKAMEGPRAVRFHFGRGTITGLVTAIGDDLVRLDSIEPDEKPVIFSASSKGWDADVLTSLEYAVAQRDARELHRRREQAKTLREVAVIRVLEVRESSQRSGMCWVVVRVGTDIDSERITVRELDYHTDDVKPWLQVKGWRREALCTIDRSRIIVHAWVGEEIAPPPSSEPAAQAVQSAQADDESFVELTDDPASEDLDDVTEHA